MVQYKIKPWGELIEKYGEYKYHIDSNPLVSHGLWEYVNNNPELLQNDEVLADTEYSCDYSIYMSDIIYIIPNDFIIATEYKEVTYHCVSLLYKLKDKSYQIIYSDTTSNKKADDLYIGGNNPIMGGYYIATCVHTSKDKAYKDARECIQRKLDE